MEWVETTGRTVEEAKRSALEQLGVGEDDAEFEVVAEPKIGLFGRLKEEARVRARVQPRYPRAKGDRRDRRRSRAARPDTGPGANIGAPAPAAQTEMAAATPRRSSRRPDDLQGAGTSERSTPRRRRRSGGTGPSVPASDGATVNERPAISDEELAQAAEGFLSGLLHELGAQAQIRSERPSEEVLELTITGEGLGTLIGPKGSTLVALQELTRTVLQRRGPRSETRVVVDVNGYRRRRAEALARFARQVASDVVATGTKRALEPMPPADRKVVHDTLGDVDGVETISEGEEPERRVVVVPAGGTGLPVQDEGAQQDE